jgi:AAA+ superfamily predicted ATPase
VHKLRHVSKKARAMPNRDLCDRIIAFASHVGRDAAQSPEAVARGRNWISAAGDVTEDGRALIAALDDQRQTRTVFRGNF